MTTPPQNAKLPAELEMQIFTLAASLHPRSIPTLVLVAQRVKLWTEPLLYRAFVVFYDESFGNSCPLRRTYDVFRQMLQSKPAAAAEHVRNLCIASVIPAPELEEIFSTCSSTSTLAMIFSELVPELLPAVARMPLQRLSVLLQSMFGEASTDFGHPIFSRLTHLDIHDYLTEDRWTPWSGISLLPCLTHVSFRGCSVKSIFEGILTHCRNIQVLALVVSVADLGCARLGTVTRDFRFVVIVVKDFLEDWEQGALGAEDYWVRAAKFIAQRRSGEVEATRFIIQ
ncbi:hypothetical protein B0H19DRAFT_1110536 [Mycena capillaripes]|nr:hypothetical protein B0H19DRAFT_1110536 [Mycena capillaripes]